MLDIRTDPSDLLFRDHLRGNGGGPLFKSRADLAQTIISEGFPGRTEESLRAYLSQVLKPATSSRSRPLSEKMESAILDACAKRLSKNIDFDEFKQRFTEAFSFLKSSAPDPFAILPITSLDVEKASEKGKSVIFTMEPAEITESQSAYSLRDQMIERLHLTEELMIDNLHTIRVSYEFYVPDKETAIFFWQRLYKYLAERIKLSPELIDNNLKIINDKVNPKLSISSVFPKDCSLDVLMLDPFGSDRQGYHFYYHKMNEKDYISLAKISNNSLESWYKYTYRPYLTPGTESYKKLERAWWEDLKDEIISKK